jgi:hypothetical protein
MTLHGSAYPLPASAHPTNASASSSSPGRGTTPILRTPLASDSIRGNEPIWHVKQRRGTITLSHQLIELALHGPEGSPGPNETLFTATLNYLAELGSETLTN